LATRGQFGDLFGSVNALFSGLAFAGLYFAIRLQQDQLVLQRTELTLQREELALTRQELARTASAQEKSEQALAAQARAANISARLAAANYLYDEAERSINSIKSYSAGSTEEAQLKSARQTKNELMQDIRKLYSSLREIEKRDAA
jgi:hypothetical protein